MVKRENWGEFSIHSIQSSWREFYLFLYDTYSVGDKGKQSSRPYMNTTLRTVSIRALSCGLTHVLALKDNGDVYSWGESPGGALGGSRLGFL